MVRATAQINTLTTGAQLMKAKVNARFSKPKPPAAPPPSAALISFEEDNNNVLIETRNTEEQDMELNLSSITLDDISAAAVQQRRQARQHEE